jgi:predicted nuclease of predicted toxin-antitoxin system
MKFLVDAQLPWRLARFLRQAGHDVVHTSDLPDGNRTPDRQVAELADSQGRVVVTKDRDFRDSHLLMKSPRRLLVVKTGNITNDALLALFQAHLDAIIEVLGDADFAELGPDALVAHRRRDDTAP